MAAALILAVAACGKRDMAGGTAAADPPIRSALRAIPVIKNIVVDQFGYLPLDAKVAVIRKPQEGYDSPDNFTAAAVYEVRRADDGRIAFSGAATEWNHGTVQASSGDRGWWFDFSALQTPGLYVITDPLQRSRSPAFRIDGEVYKPVLKAAMRMYFYQRSGFRKQQPFADACWEDDAAYLGKNQDGEAHDVTDPKNAAKIRNLSGGWFDAGDTDKYVTYAAPAVHQLLSAYQQNPAAFTDDFGIPESGNGIPDVLDEINWETDWLARMQYPDGSAALKVGAQVNVRASPPSSDDSERYYVPSCTSATIAIAGIFAHAAYVEDPIPQLAARARELRRRAIAAWRNFNSKPHEEHCDTGAVLAGNADWDANDQESEAVVAAIYLAALTGDDLYTGYIRQHYLQMRPYRDFGWSRYNAEQGDALSFYAALPAAAGELQRKILEDRRNDIPRSQGVYGFEPDLDLYRAFMQDEQYHWGSNQVRANYGNTNLDVVNLPLDIADTSSFRKRALETLHYFHGVNPLGVVYLTNMYRYGATSSNNEIFHAWFPHYSGRLHAWLGRAATATHLDRIGVDFRSKWDDARTSACGPPPGYLPGGPNFGAQHNGVSASVRPPVGQPRQKAYRDWNLGGPDAAWAVTEPAIYYQAAYVKLLSAFVH